MRFLYFADIHLYHKNLSGREDDYANTSLNKLRQIVDAANKEKVDYVISSGDFFHKSTVSIEYICSIMSILKKLKCRFYCVIGNHDIKGHNKNTISSSAMSILVKANLLHILDRDIGETIKEDIVIEGNGYCANYEKEENYTPSSDDVDILICHGMLTDKPLMNEIEHVNIKDIKNPAFVTFSGHDHKGFGIKKINDKYFINTGSVSRTDRGKNMLEHAPGFLICTATKESFKAEKYTLSYVKDVFIKDCIADEFIKSIEDIESVESEEDLVFGDDITNLIDKYTSLYLEQAEETVLTEYKKESKEINIKKVIIKNFRAHEFLEVNMSGGLNVIVGKNNVGKSTILKAIKWVFHDVPKGDDFIRTGESECYVKVIFKNGHYIEKTKNKKTSTYKVYNGENVLEFKGFGQKMPLEITNEHQSPYINIWGDKICLNYQGQLDSLFLVSRSGFEIAKSIGAITKTEMFDGAIAICTKDIKKNTSDIKNLDKQIKKTEAELEKSISDSERFLKIYNDLEVLDESINNLSYIKHTHECVASKKDMYIDKNVLKEYDLINPLNDIVDLMIDTSIAINKHDKINKTIDNNFDNIDGLYSLICDISDLIKLFNKSDKYVFKTFSTIEERNEQTIISDITTLITSISIFNEKREKYNTLIKSIKSISNNIEDLFNEESALLDKINKLKCPICGNKYNTDC